MKKRVLFKSRILILICFITFINGQIYGQTCTGSTPANPGARTGSLYTTATINPGNTSTVHWFQGTVTGATITMSGTSKLVIKTGSSLTLAAGAYTIPSGCIIYVESGASFIVSGSLTTTGSLINLGTVTINGLVSLGSGSVYNDGTLSSTSYLHLTQSSFIFLNGGRTTFTHIYYQTASATSSICLRPGSIFNILSASEAYTITGSGTLPTGGLFKYNSTDISNNSACSPANPARINYYSGWSGGAGLFVFGPTADASNPVANHASITIVGSLPASSNTGSCILVTSGAGYSGTAPQNFNLNTHSPVPTVTGSYFQYCRNSSVPLSSMASGTNLLWYTAATGGSGTSTAPTVTTSSAGLQTFWVNQNVTGSCVGPRTPINIDVVATDATSAVTATNNGPRCTGQSLTLTGGGSGISNWSWTGPNSYTSSSQSPTVSASATTAMSGTYTLITVQSSGSCRNSATTTATVSGSVPAQPGAFTTSSATVCQGQNNVAYTIPTVSGATSYTWSYSGSGASISGGTTNSVTINFSASATSGTLSASAVNGCGTGTARQLSVTVNTLPAQPGAFTTSSATVCQGQNNVAYTIPTVSGATSYTWSYSGSGASISGGTTNSVTINFSASATSGTLSASAVNGCGTGTARQLSVTVNALPVATASNNGPVCAGTTLTLSATTLSGASYSWTGPNSFTSNNQNPTLTYIGSYAGTFSVQVTQNGCSASFNTDVASNTSTPGQWVGAYSNAWSNANNWCGATIPTSSTNVTIPAGATNMPVNSGSANTANLSINSSASLINNNSATLNIYGNFTNNGSYSDNGTIVFTGSSTQTVNGSNIFHHLTINNNSGVTLNNVTILEGNLTLSNGNLNTNDNLYVDLNTGAIAGSGSGSTSGEITFRKPIWGDKYHYISSPISNKTADDWNDDVTIKFGLNANLYTYNETVPDTNKLVGWEPVPSLATPIEDMKGYALYFTRFTYYHILDVTGTYNHAASFSNSGLTNTPSTTPSFKPSSDGWNLVGNPYPSTLDWDAPSGWNKTGLDNAIYCWNPRTEQYVSYIDGVGTNGGTRYIPSMQGFWVRVSTSGGTGTLAMNNNVRSTALNLDVWRTAAQENILKINITSDDYNDETVIRLKENASENFDSQADAFKLHSSGNTPSLYTSSSDAEYSINSLPEDIVQKTVPLNIIAGFNGSYKLSINITGFKDAEYLVLEDRLLEHTQDLRENNTYTVNLNTGKTEGRFFIAYKKREEIATGNTAAYIAGNNIDISAYLNNINILFAEQNNGKANVAVFDALGKKVYELNNTNILNGNINFELPDAQTGIYIVKVNSDNKAKAQQVYISRQ